MIDNTDIFSLIQILNESQIDRLVSLIKEFKKEGLKKPTLFGIDIDKMLIDIDASVEYEKNKRIKRENIRIAMSKGETTIPKEQWGVHSTHCCVKHGCKYGYLDCPVEMKLVTQEFPCESCDWESSSRQNLS